ncbi:A/G-specific adenine glycosylase [Novosphingobium rosa]|uniref:A/G-specific adenine glycosylase n=1 Tax=Novosphingobium rosa TaxID=76978 RepID=UPI000835F12D|nr:A/G-specific adenine glycosylase [Novosphingobium rosa]
MDARGDSPQHPVTQALLAWYRSHARTLPWRAPPGAPRMEAYRVWLSEVMLQQTTVAAVIPYFENFTRRWTSVEALAKAPEEDVMAAWAGLGYYSRARRLVECARVVAGLGAFPQDEAGLRALPGLGAYTAAAVASIAFGQRAVVVDGNVERVVSRLLAIDTPLPAAKSLIRDGADSLTPDDHAGDFAQAMMDLGATICTPRSPKCLICPVAEWCKARAEGKAEAYPVKPPKVAKPLRTGTAFWITRQGPQGVEVWLVRREGKGLLGGMRALPEDGWTARVDGSRQPPFVAAWRDLGAVTHVFTHFSLTMTVQGATAHQPPEGPGEWWPLARIDEAGLPTVFARAAARAMAGSELEFP